MPVHLLILTSCCNLLQATQSPLFHSTGFITRSTLLKKRVVGSLCQSTCRYLHLVHLRQVHQQQAKSTSKCRSKSSLSKPFKEASLQHSGVAISFKCFVKLIALLLELVALLFCTLHPYCHHCVFTYTVKMPVLHLSIVTQTLTLTNCAANHTPEPSLGNYFWNHPGSHYKHA